MLRNEQHGFVPFCLVVMQRILKYQTLAYVSCPFIYEKTYMHAEKHFLTLKHSK